MSSVKFINTVSVIAIKAPKDFPCKMKVGKVYEVSKTASKILIARKVAELVPSKD